MTESEVQWNPDFSNLQGTQKLVGKIRSVEKSGLNHNVQKNRGTRNQNSSVVLRDVKKAKYFWIQLKGTRLERQESLTNHLLYLYSSHTGHMCGLVWCMVELTLEANSRSWIVVAIFWWPRLVVSLTCSTGDVWGWTLASEKSNSSSLIYIKIQPKTIDLSTRLFGINPTNSAVIPRHLWLRSIVLGWILIRWNWSIGFCV